MEPDSKKFILSSLNNRRLELILFPTEQCNFRCTYCYESFLIGRMSQSVINGVKNLISARATNIDHLHLSWFGGEPLAARDIIYDLCEYAETTCGEMDIHLGGSTTTNGYHLSPATMKTLCRYNQTSFQVSLDGFGEGHDQTRKLASGKGSFQCIWSNLQELKKTTYNFHIMLRLHLTPDNLKSMYKLATQISNEFLTDSRFTTFVKPIGNWGGPNSSKIKTLNKKERSQAVDHINRLLNKSSVTDKHLPESESISTPTPYICYASMPNSLAIRADGRVQKCTVNLDDPANTVGHLNEDGSIDIDDKKMHLWMRGYKDFDVASLRCPAQHFPSQPTVGKSDIPLVELVEEYNAH